jgi:hypothetical protein
MSLVFKDTRDVAPKIYLGRYWDETIIVSLTRHGKTTSPISQYLPYHTNLKSKYLINSGVKFERFSQERSPDVFKMILL